MTERAISYQQLATALDNSYSVWRDELLAFNSQHSALQPSSSSSVALGDEEARAKLLTCCIRKLEELSSATREEYYEGSRIVCDLLRICARQVACLDEVFASSSALQPILSCCIRMHDEEQKEAESLADDQHRWIETNATAFRCLTNILFNASAALDAFCASSAAIASLIDFLATIQRELPVELQFQCTKLLFLITAQR
jgi:hypothetical protein